MNVDDVLVRLYPRRMATNEDLIRAIAAKAAAPIMDLLRERLPEMIAPAIVAFNLRIEQLLDEIGPEGRKAVLGSDAGLLYLVKGGLDDEEKDDG